MDFLTALQIARTEQRHMHAQSGVLRCDVLRCLPTVYAPVNRPRLVQYHTQIGQGRDPAQWRLWQPERVPNLRTPAPVTLPYGLREIQRPALLPGYE